MGGGCKDPPATEQYDLKSNVYGPKHFGAVYFNFFPTSMKGVPMKVPISTSAVRNIYKARGLTMKDLAEQSEEIFSLPALKYLLITSKNHRLSEEQLYCLAELLGVDVEAIIDPGFALRDTIPFKISRLTNQLYDRERFDINPYYHKRIEEKKQLLAYQNLLRQVPVVYAPVIKLLDDGGERGIFNACANILQQCSVMPAGNLYSTQLCLAPNELVVLFLRMQVAIKDQNQTAATLYLLLYQYCIFEALLLEELVASAAQRSVSRKSSIIEQYFKLAISAEQLRKGFTDLILNKNVDVHSEDEFIAEGLQDTVHHVLVLLAACCHTIQTHQNSTAIASEVINRPVVHEVLMEMQRVSDRFKIAIPSPSIVDAVNTRFGRRYLEFQAEYNVARSVLRELKVNNQLLCALYLK
jgi:transcriptional regulator with XRE-family HTH domain